MQGDLREDQANAKPRRFRFRLMTLMVLVGISALLTAAGVHVARMTDEDRFDLGQRTMLLSPFLVLILLKTGLVLLARKRRWGATEPPPGESTSAPGT